MTESENCKVESEFGLVASADSTVHVYCKRCESYSFPVTNLDEALNFFEGHEDDCFGGAEN